MHPEKRKPATVATVSRPSNDLGRINGPKHSPSLPDAQRRLAVKIAASAGLSLAVAGVLVVIACGDGRPA